MNRRFDWSGSRRSCRCCRSCNHRRCRRSNHWLRHRHNWNGSYSRPLVGRGRRRWVCSSRRRTRNHRSRRDLAGNGRCCGRRSHDVSTLARLGDDLTRSLRRRGSLRCVRHSGHIRQRRWLRCGRRGHMSSGRRNHYRRTSCYRRRCLRCGLSLLALENCLEGIARLRHLRQVKLRPVVGRRSRRTRAARSAGQICPYFLRLIEFDGTGVCFFLRDAHRCKSVQNGLALYFQFACQIVDSNFAHPSLFASLAPLAAHIGLFEVGIVISIISETEAFAISRTPYGAASHGRVHRQCLRLRPLAPHPPACQLCRYPARSAPREHLHR